MRNKRVQMLCEGALTIALSIALTYAELDLWYAGGSISAAMLPIILFSVRWGFGWGVGVGLVFGTLKYFLGEGWVISWVSIIFDYSVAYAFVGFAGLFKRKAALAPVAALAGGVARFLVHFVSGVTVYRMVEPTELFGTTFHNAELFSLVYNGSYMLPSIVLCVVACLVLSRVKPVRRWLSGEDLT